MSLLAEVVSDDTGAGVPSDKGSMDFAAIKEKVFGRKPSASVGKKKSSPPPDESPGVSEKELNEIFAGENWEELSALYFNARFALTGWDGFLLSKEQQKVLGLSLSKTMKMLLKIDPGYIALVIFTTNFAGLIGQKELTYRQLMKQSREPK